MGKITSGEGELLEGFSFKEICTPGCWFSEDGREEFLVVGGYFIDIEIDVLEMEVVVIGRIFDFIKKTLDMEWFNWVVLRLMMCDGCYVHCHFLVFKQKLYGSM